MATLKLPFVPFRGSCRVLRRLELLGYCTTTSCQPSSSDTIQDHTHEVALAKSSSKPAYVNPTGWAPPTGKPAPFGVEPDIPYRVRRSVYHQLPVYTEYRNGRTRVLTRISKIDGDIVKMEKHLRQYLQVDNLRCRVDEVIGSIFISGDHRVAVRRFLKEMGF